MDQGVIMCLYPELIDFFIYDFVIIYDINIKININNK